MGKGRRTLLPVDKQVHARFIVDNDMHTKRATRCVLQRVGKDEFLLMLFEARLPIVVGTEDERIKQLQKLDYVDEVCIGRYSLTETRFVQMQKLMTTFVQDMGLKEDPDESEAVIG